MDSCVVSKVVESRPIYEDKGNTTPRKWRWLQELRQQREKDIKTEMVSK
jgi:hypothetical protein